MGVLITVDFFMALINFKLRHPDNIAPWGDGNEAGMHWYGLTDVEYWIEAGNAVLYEYTDDILNGSEHDSRYADFQVFRFIEDFTGLFEAIVASVPDTFYSIARNNNYLYRFYGAAQVWLEDLSSNPANDLEYYGKAIEWIYSRTLTAEHLNAGPGISFFRNGSKISIVWKADHLAGNNVAVWTAQNGDVEMEYEVFVKEVEAFGHRFFEAMDRQVKIAVEKDWGAVQVNKERLVQEQEERRVAFQQKVGILKGQGAKSTDWEVVTKLVNEMFG